MLEAASLAREADVAIRYARTAPTEFTSRELFRDTFHDMCSPALLSGNRRTLSAAELLQYPLIHFDWFKPDSDTPTWQKWWATAGTIDAGSTRPEAARGCHICAAMALLSMIDQTVLIFPSSNS
ncbi:LysR substrate-binding domain-containing protein [Litchfieldella anticariensis]|uniref:LysR substrate-binding domain-containing protein n=1 Tax=Litchfieldella anticariensis TaxID=258591 RepID=UPI0009DBB068|nr:LysR substrate-binding domain-containing protein [Halomonas anticariensis]